MMHGRSGTYSHISLKVHLLTSSGFQWSNGVDPQIVIVQKQELCALGVMHMIPSTAPHHSHLLLVVYLVLGIKRHTACAEKPGKRVLPCVICRASSSSSAQKTGQPA
jgi:hypothetical protein